MAAHENIVLSLISCVHNIKAWWVTEAISSVFFLFCEDYHLKHVLLLLLELTVSLENSVKNYIRREKLFFSLTKNCLREALRETVSVVTELLKSLFDNKKKENNQTIFFSAVVWRDQIIVCW